MRKLLGILVLFIVILSASCGNKHDVTIGLNDGMDTVEIYGTWTDVGAYLDLEDQELVVYSGDDVDTSVLGEQVIAYSTIYDDIEYEIIRYVMVADQTNPVLSLLEGVDTVSVDSNWFDGGCTVTDNSEEVLTCGTVSVVDTSIIGVQEVIYTAIDSSGNEGTITRVVTVVE